MKVSRHLDNANPKFCKVVGGTAEESDAGCTGCNSKEEVGGCENVGANAEAIHFVEPPSHRGSRSTSETGSDPADVPGF